MSAIVNLETGPIFSDEAEMSVLGSMLLHENALIEVLGTLTDTDFYRPSHRLIFQAMRRLHDRKIQVDLTTLRDELNLVQKLLDAGGESYLIQLAEYVPSPANAAYYASSVQDRSMMRKLEDVGRDIVGLVRAPSEMTAYERVSEAERKVFEINNSKLGSYFSPIQDLAGEFQNEIDRILDTGIAPEELVTHFSDLDQKINGLNKGNLIIVAARPGMGKTAFALELAIRAAKQNMGSVAVFSLEMSASQLAQRMVSMLSGVNAFKLKTPDLVNQNYAPVSEAIDALRALPIYIDATSGISPMEMLAKCRRLARDGELGLVVVDYLQLMQGSKKTENRVQEISEIARGLKAMAGSLQVPIIALSQLNRGVEARDNKRPQLGDLRESGSIEAEADIVLMLYRDSYYQATESVDIEPDYNPDHVEAAEVNVAKNRNGVTGMTVLGFQPSYMRFHNLDEDSIENYRKSTLEKKSGITKTSRKGKGGDSGGDF